MNRRQFVSGLLATAAAAKAAVPVRQITRGPKYHWFGYYDKLQFDPTSRYLLGMQVGFEHRSPRPDDEIRVGVVDTGDKDRWTDLGKTTAWNWQQGCMLQWLPGSKTEIIWNDREDGQFISRIVDFRTGKQRVLPAPIYTLSPDGKSAVYPDFRRLNDCRPGYGYAGIQDPNFKVRVPDDAGIWHLDIASGRSSLILPLSDAERIPYPKGYSSGAKHWFNHLLYSPDSSRFIFLHRWRGEAEQGRFSTRMFTADRDGKNLHILDPYGSTSHFIWRDPQHVLAWAWHPSIPEGDKFYLYRDQTDKVEVVGRDVMVVNGHCTYLPGNKFILNDTYPDKDRNQNPYIYEIATGKRTSLGLFHSPKEYTGEWRCDNHPRFSPDGKRVCIDSPHNFGRQMYLIDISSITVRG